MVSATRRRSRPNVRHVVNELLATTLEDFDFAYDPAIPAATIRDLATLRFLTQGESIILHAPWRQAWWPMAWATKVLPTPTGPAE